MSDCVNYVMFLIQMNFVLSLRMKIGQKLKANLNPSQDLKYIFLCAHVIMLGITAVSPPQFLITGETSWSHSEIHML